MLGFWLLVPGVPEELVVQELLPSPTTSFGAASEGSWLGKHCRSVGHSTACLSPGLLVICPGQTCLLAGIVTHSAPSSSHQNRLPDEREGFPWLTQSSWVLPVDFRLGGSKERPLLPLSRGK